jgi:hypothetical protein
MNLYEQNKIFVTGVAASGKTEFAKQYSKRFWLPYEDFDKKFNYTMIHYENLDKIFLDNLKENFIVDGIPFRFYNSVYDINAFLKYCKEREDIKIVCLCCTDKDVYKKRLINKNYKSFVYGFIEFHWYYLVGINRFDHMNIDFFDTAKNEYVTKEELLRRIEWIKPLSSFM